jgi:hypothetical protein
MQFARCIQAQGLRDKEHPRFADILDRTCREADCIGSSGTNLLDVGFP